MAKQGDPSGDVDTRDIELSLVMPCLNESETIETCVLKAKGGLDRLGIVGEIVVADNGSTDGSIEKATKAGARVVHVVDKGYGSALMGGFQASRGKYIIMGDADDSYDWSAIDGFIEKLRTGADLVMGCRLPSGGGTIRKGAMPFLNKWIGNPVLSGFGRIVFKCPITDFHCGMRGFNKAAIIGLALQTTGMEFASEMVIRPHIAGLTIEEVPITLHPDGRSGKPHLRPFRDGWRHLRFLLMFSPRWLFLYPGLLLLLLGVIGFSAILPGPRRVGMINLDLNTLLVSALFILVGFQTVSFGVSARIYAANRRLLPPDKAVERVLSVFTLERSLLLSLFLVLLGIVVMTFAIYRWSETGFGNFPETVGVRLVASAVILTALGIQLIFTRFFWGMLKLK